MIPAPSVIPIPVQPVAHPSPTAQPPSPEVPREAIPETVPETQPSAAEVYYANCDAARAAGAAPIREGQPGYRSGLDRDDDGVACE